MNNHPPFSQVMAWPSTLIHEWIGYSSSRAMARP